MPTVCCAIGCKHTTGNGICHLKRFPTDEKRAIVWAENVRGSKWNRKGWELLCDCHFDVSQFEKLREDGARKLKHNAIPTLFPTHTVPLGDGLSNPLETSFTFDTQFEPMGLELLGDEGVAKLPDTVPFLFPSETLMLDEVHFEESAFELHRADGRRKLKPNSVPTIHSISKNAPNKKKQSIAPRIEFPFIDDGDDSLGLSALVPSKTNGTELSQTIGDYDYQLEGIFGHDPQKKQFKEASASDFVSSLLTRKNDVEHGSNTMCGAEVGKDIGNAGDHSNGVHFEDTVLEPCSLDGEIKLESVGNNTTCTVTPTVRNKRKQSVKPRIELPSIDSDDERAVKAKVRSSESRTKQTQGRTVNESIGDKPPRKRLKAVNVPEYVANLPSRSDEAGILSICRSADLEAEAAENSFGNSSGNLGEILNEDNAKHDRPVSARKRGKLKKYRNDALSDCTHIGEPRLSKQGGDLCEVSASEAEDENYNCFVCCKPIAARFAIPLSVLSELSSIPLSQHVEDIVGLEVDTLEVVCRRCSSLLNHIDKTEAELSILKGAISTCTKGKKLGFQNDPDILRNLQVLDRFSTVVDSFHNVLSVEELLLIKTGGKVIDKESSFNHPGEEVTDSVSSQGETKELVAEIYVEGLEGHNSARGKGRKQIVGLESDGDPISTECVSRGLDLADKSNSIEVNKLEGMEKESPVNELSDKVECICGDKSAPENSIKEANGDQQLGSEPKSHVCKICSFKTVHESVMIWHLRMHMKNHRWCDFCTTAIPEEESAFILAKKTRPKYKLHKRRTNPKPSFILPAIRVNPVDASSDPLSSVPLSSFPLSVIPLQTVDSQNPVVVISGEEKGVEEVIAADTSRDHKNVDQITVEDNVSSKVLIYSDSVVISETSMTKDSSISKSLVTSFAPRVELSIGTENEQLETYSSMYASETEQLGKSDDLASVGTEFNESLNNCSNPDVNAVLRSYCNLPDTNIADSESERTNNDFIGSGSQCLKLSGIHSEEAYGEVVTEASFLDSLSTQPGIKYSEIHPKIVDEAAMQSTLSSSNGIPEEGVTNKDVSFTRSGSLGVSDIAMAYENSVAALMCQSDDSDGMLSYN